MKILLINPPCGHRFKAQHLGLSYLDAVLKKEGYKSYILDCALYGLDFDNVKNEIERINPDILGISVLQRTVSISCKISDYVKKNRHIPIVFGGHTPTILSDYFLNNGYCDYVVRGEGEETLKELLTFLYNTKEPKNVKGIDYIKNGKLIKNNPRPLIENLDELPFPTRYGLELSIDYGNITAGILGSRGCPYNCTFCSVATFYRSSPGKMWRKRSPENIGKEIEYVKKEYGIKYFRFIDDNPLGNIKTSYNRSKELSEELKKYNIKFSLEARIDTIDSEIIQNLIDAGCIRIFFGIDACNEKDNLLYNKGYENMEIVKRKLRELKQLEKKNPNFSFKCFIIPLNAYTTMDDLKEKWKFIKEDIGVEHLTDKNDMFKELQLISGTPITEKHIQDGKCYIKNIFDIKPKYSKDILKVIHQKKS